MRHGFIILLFMLIPLPLSAEVVMTDTWSTTPDRTWIGREWWANRLQDWCIEDGRLVCLESRPTRGVRTAHWITNRLAAGRKGLRLSVDIETGVEGLRAGPEAFAGFLLGSGGDHVDHRLTAQVHHQPAEDGGMLAVVDGNGVVSIRQFDVPGKIPGSWSIGSKVDLKALPLIPGQKQSGTGLAADKPSRFRLITDQQGEGMTVIAQDPETGSELSRTRLDQLPLRYRDGGIALVSHRGPKERGRGFAFKDLKSFGDGVRTASDREFGPVLSTMYTIDDGVLKLTAQMPPLGSDDTQTADLEIKRDGTWTLIDQGEWDEDSATFTFRVEDWNADDAIPYRVVYQERRLGDSVPWQGRYQGVFRAEPDDDEVVLAALNCQKVYTGGLKWNHDGLWMPHVKTVAGVEARDPDLVFFAGDQIYEGDLTPVDRRSIRHSLHDYLYKWYRFCWSFRDLTRNRPAIAIPDDHDVYHGNIWGAGGKKAVKTDSMSAQDSGGYKMPARFVNAVHRTQTSNLPDPHDPTPIEQDISVYYTDLDWGGVSFAVLADRMFKSSPTVAVPEGKFRNGWPQAEGFDPTISADVEDAVLLGERQEQFLEEWAVDWDEDDWAKAVLSQTLFCNIATLPEGATSGGVIPGLPVPLPGDYPENYWIIADADSNGWPQSGRNRALEMMRMAGAIHVCGDQHLGSTVRYGVDEFDDAGWAFCVPAVSNTWPRRWFPPEPGANQREGDPPYTGQYLDGWGNHMTVAAVSNPVQTGQSPSNLYDRMPGYGIIRFLRPNREVIFECWPRWTDPGAADDEQYSGWPVRFPINSGYGEPKYGVARIECDQAVSPLIRVRSSSDSTIDSVRRLGPGGGVLELGEAGPWDVEASLDGRDWIMLGTGMSGLEDSEDLPVLRYR